MFGTKRTNQQKIISAANVTCACVTKASTTGFIGKLTVVQREPHEGSENMCRARWAIKQPVKTGMAICTFRAISLVEPQKNDKHYLCKLKVQKVLATYQKQ